MHHGWQNRRCGEDNPDASGGAGWLERLWLTRPRRPRYAGNRICLDGGALTLRHSAQPYRGQMTSHHMESRHPK